MEILGWSKISFGFVHKVLWKNQKNTLFNQSNKVFTVVQLLWCSTLSDTMDLSPPGSSVHRISQARMLEWVAMLSSRGSSRPRDQTFLSCTGRHDSLPLAPPGKPSPIVFTIEKHPLISEPQCSSNPCCSRANCVC